MRHYYSLIIDLTGRPCLIVGGGEVACRKIESLAAAGAAVTVISPDLLPQARALADAGTITWRKERFASQDVSGYTLVVAATNQPEVNQAVYRAVKACGGWINIVDRPDLCNVIVPSAVQRGKLMISVSTSGASPGLAQKIKQEIERAYGPEYESYVDFLADMRQRVLAEVADPKRRREIFRRLLDDAYLTASDEQRKHMAAALLREQGPHGGMQGGNDETLESRLAKEHACVNPDQLGD